MEGVKDEGAAGKNLGDRVCVSRSNLAAYYWRLKPWISLWVRFKFGDSFADPAIVDPGYVVRIKAKRVGIAKVKALIDEEVIPRIRNAVARVASEFGSHGHMNHMLVDEIFRGVEGDIDALVSKFAEALFKEELSVQQDEVPGQTQTETVGGGQSCNSVGAEDEATGHGYDLVVGDLSMIVYAELDDIDGPMVPSSEEDIEVADETTIVTGTTNPESQEATGDRWSNGAGGVSDIWCPSIQDRGKAPMVFEDSDNVIHLGRRASMSDQCRGDEEVAWQLQEESDRECDSYIHRDKQMARMIADMETNNEPGVGEGVIASGGGNMTTDAADGSDGDSPAELKGAAGGLVDVVSPGGGDGDAGGSQASAGFETAAPVSPAHISPGGGSAASIEGTVGGPIVEEQTNINLAMGMKSGDGAGGSLPIGIAIENFGPTDAEIGNGTNRPSDRNPDVDSTQAVMVLQVLVWVPTLQIMPVVLHRDLVAKVAVAHPFEKLEAALALECHQLL
ncbi:hypothetical protein ACQ4PT_068164 [Festuca glaucescens]